jgi:ubiquinone/menaquinone biosynthesis C-methylase UbiE
MANTQNRGPINLHLYNDLANWWPLLSAPEDYADEAEFFYQTIMETASNPPRTLLELGSGGGNNASHLKAHFEMTLVDISPGMLSVSKKLNPECAHFLGDMRSLALDRQFDAVFVHDAVTYITNLLDLQKVIYTASDHCRVEGVVLFAPDFVKESFKESTEHGGHNGRKRAARYISWTYDPDPDDNSYVMDFAYLLRHKDGKVESYYDQHNLGLFSQNEWMNLLSDAGFDPKMIRDPFDRFIFTGVKCPV